MEIILNNRERIGRSVAELRAKKGLTQRQLAELCGINYANIGKIERGAYNVSIDILSKICAVMDAQIDIVEKKFSVPE